jgi:hypothetical protein
MQDLPKGMSQKWLETAREYSEWIKVKGINPRQEKMEVLLTQLEDEIALVEYILRSYL